jgi:hypothetical protein
MNYKMANPINLDYFVCILGTFHPQCEEGLQRGYIIASIIAWLVLLVIGIILFSHTFKVPKDAITPKINQQFLYILYILLCIVRLGTFICAIFKINNSEKDDQFLYKISDTISCIVQMIIYNIIFYSWTSTTHRISYMTFHVWWMKFKRILWCFFLFTPLVAYGILRFSLSSSSLLHWLIPQIILAATLTIPSIVFWFTLRKLRFMLSTTISDQTAQSPGDDPFSSTHSHQPPSPTFKHASSFFMVGSSSSLSPFMKLDSDMSMFGHHSPNQRQPTHELLGGAAELRQSNLSNHENVTSEPINLARVAILRQISRIGWIYALVFAIYLAGIGLGIYQYGRFVYLISHCSYITLLFFYQPEKTLLLDPTQSNPVEYEEDNRSHNYSKDGALINRDDGIYDLPFPTGTYQNPRNEPERFENATSALQAATQSVLDQQRHDQRQQQLLLQQQRQQQQQQQQQQQFGSYNAPNGIPIPTTPTTHPPHLQHLAGTQSIAMNVPGGAYTTMQKNNPNRASLLPGQSPMGVGASLVESYLASQQGSSLRISQGSSFGTSLQKSTPSFVPSSPNTGTISNPTDGSDGFNIPQSPPIQNHEKSNTSFDKNPNIPNHPNSLNNPPTTTVTNAFSLYNQHQSSLPNQPHNITSGQPITTPTLTQRQNSQTFASPQPIPQAISPQPPPPQQIASPRAIQANQSAFVRTNSGKIVSSQPVQASSLGFPAPPNNFASPFQPFNQHQARQNQGQFAQPQQIPQSTSFQAAMGQNVYGNNTGTGSRPSSAQKGQRPGSQTGQQLAFSPSVPQAGNFTPGLGLGSMPSNPGSVPKSGVQKGRKRH